MKLDIKRLDSGYYHIRGDGPCNWAQPPSWPCADEDALIESVFHEAGNDFRMALCNENDRLLQANNHKPADMGEVEG